MEQLIWFLGRFHVLVLHLPLGILSLAAALEILVRFRAFRSLEPGLATLWGVGALTSLATVVLGVMHASEPSFAGVTAVELHRWAGIGLCIAAFLVAALRTRVRPAVGGWWAVPVVTTVLLMFVTGHLGGNLTHGETYLVQYAPAPLRSLAGLPPAATPRARPADVASADIYLDVVQPALEKRCINCHNDSKNSGGFSVVTYESLMKGGEKGVVITPGDASRSNLYHRVSLAPNDPDFMPKEGKTPLDGNEVAAIGWWIAQGAPRSASIASLEVTPEVSTALESILGIGAGAAVSGSAAVAGEGTLPVVPEASPAAIAAVVSHGFTVRKVSAGSNLVDVDYTSPQPLTPAVMTDLVRLGPHVLRLNLRRAGLTDADVKKLLAFTHLRQLRLEKNDITDAAAGDLSNLRELTSLNLTNTRITDSGLAEVGGLPKLRYLYVWGTAVTPAGVKKLRNQRTDIELIAGLTEKDVPQAGKVVPPDF